MSLLLLVTRLLKLSSADNVPALQPSMVFRVSENFVQTAFVGSMVGPGFHVSGVVTAVPQWRFASASNIPHKDMLVPNMSDPTTVLNIAKLTFNSYIEPEDKDWANIPDFNITDKFGWSSDGLRGYVFTNEAQNLIVIAIKGTSLSTPIIGGGPTAPRDKFNDNMMFSCCCGQVSSSWKPICDCADTKLFECSMDCINKATSFSGSYYNLANTIYMAVLRSYPRDVSIWLAGHSLGGALASLLGLTNDVPVVAFESPGEFLYAQRIGLLPDLDTVFAHYDNYTAYLKTLSIFHIGNTRDPIFNGECLSQSYCYYVGYALESKCHAGYEEIFSVQGNQEIQAGYDIRYHSIERIIKEFLEPASSVPECKVLESCQECSNWKWK